MKGHQVRCPCCDNVTTMSRGAHTSVGRNGCVYITCWCDHCDEKLTVKTMDKDGRKTGNIVEFPKRKLWKS